MKFSPYIDFLTHTPNFSHRSVSLSVPGKQVKLCFNLNFARFDGLSLEMPITKVFSLARALSNSENCMASLVQLDVSARGKKYHHFFANFFS